MFNKATADAQAAVSRTGTVERHRPADQGGEGEGVASLKRTLEEGDGNISDGYCEDEDHDMGDYVRDEGERGGDDDGGQAPPGKKAKHH